MSINVLSLINETFPLQSKGVAIAASLFSFNSLHAG